MKTSLRTHSAAETREVGVRMGRCLKGRNVILLDGELGSGKTILAKGIYCGLGGRDEEQILSPSYTLVHLHDDADVPIYHVDLFRLEKPGAIMGLDYEDFLFLNPGTTIVEWPREARDLLEEGDYLHVQFQPGASPEERILTLSSAGEHFLDVFAELTSSC